MLLIVTLSQLVFGTPTDGTPTCGAVLLKVYSDETLMKTYDVSPHLSNVNQKCVS